MLAYALKRLAWGVPMLIGISLVTFLLLDLVPVERSAARTQQANAASGAGERAEAVRSLRVRYGMVDPETGEERSFWARYATWVQHAVRMDFAPPDEAPERFRARFWSAVLVSTLLGFAALFAALSIGIPLGAWLGARAGRGADRAIGIPLLALSALPEFLIATLLVLFIGGGLGPALFPPGGLRTPGASTWSALGQAVDLARHLALPVATLALAPTVAVARYLRDAVVRSSREGFVEALRAWGVPESEVRRRVLRHSFGPIWTLLGTLLPALIAGSVVVEQVFGLPGFGRLAFRAVLERDVSVVMASVTFTAVLVLVGLLLSDLLHRRSDPRVVLR